MLKDLINSKMNESPFMGVMVYIIKKYVVKSGQKESFIVSNSAVVLIKSGRLKIQTKEAVQDLLAHDLLILYKKSNVVEVDAQDMPQFYLIRFSSEKDRISIPLQEMASFLNLTGQEAIKISLDESDYLVLSLICRLLYAETKNERPSDFEMELRRISTNLLIFELKLIYTKYFTATELHISKAEKLAGQFLSVLSIHCRKHRNVKFYSGVLYVNSEYLNRVVKEVTGKPAKKIITEAVLAEAVNLLDDFNYTIAEIADELEFSSSSSFSIFFKKAMSCTPSEYRSKTAQRIKNR